MRALTVHQPWAWALIYADKVENRTWGTSYRGPVAIHAGQRIDEAGLGHPALLDALPLDGHGAQVAFMQRNVLGAVIGVADLVDVHRPGISTLHRSRAGAPCRGGREGQQLMARPERIQLSRRKGWRKPEGAIVVARPTRWGNPYAVHAPEIVVHPDGRDWYAPDNGARQVAVDLFREDLEHGRLLYDVLEVRAQLQGRDLACWCPLDQPCHADVLLEVANR